MAKFPSCIGLVALTATSVTAPPVIAQPAVQPGDEEPATIIVTARKRDEALSDVPVAVTAFGRAQIERLALNSVDDLANFTPGLTVSESAVSSGGGIYLRGVGSGSSNPMIDQSVAINIDGMQVGTFNVRKTGQIDVGQIEVLRGPQALFFGKNSPGGVISFRTNDPGPNREVVFSASHEFVSNDNWLQAVVSGPVSDALGLRLVGRYSDLGGYFNVKSVSGISDPLVVPSKVKHWPSGDEYFLRGTLLFEPGDGLQVRAKVAYNHSRIHGGSMTAYQRIACPYGAPQLQPDFPCKADRDVYLGSAPPAVMELEPRAQTLDGLGQRTDKQLLGTLEVNYDLGGGLRATALSGYYWFDEVNGHNASGGPRATVIPAYLPFNTSQFTQELRLASDWQGLINFMGGLFYESRKTEATQNGIITILPSGPFRMPDETAIQHQKAYSAFGQLTLKPTDALEVAAGLRWSREKKRLQFYYAGTDVTANLARDHLSFSNFSPEVTVSYHINPEIMAFASYKHGFKSGGFDSGFTNGGILKAPFSNNYNEEHVKGIEGGIKGTLGSLFFDLTAYTYDYDDMQVGTYDPDTISFKILNAAAARVRGIELNTNWRTPVSGLSLNGAIAYNDARFLNFLAGCYVGQTPAMGCNLTPNPRTGAFMQQDLSGRRLSNAPEWSGMAGANYSTHFVGDHRLDLSFDLSYSGTYTTNLLQGPYDVQKRFAKLNASVKFSSGNQVWDVMLIGRNLTNKYTYSSTSTLTFTGSGSGIPNARLGDLGAPVSRGREIFLQATVRPSFLN